jgi:hypothetical protein
LIPITLAVAQKLRVESDTTIEVKTFLDRKSSMKCALFTTCHPAFKLLHTS